MLNHAMGRPVGDPAVDSTAAELERLNRFAISLLQQRNLDELLWSMAENIGVLLGFEDCVIYLLRGETLTQAAAYGAKADRRRLNQPMEIALGQGIVGTVAERGEPELVADTEADPRYIRDCFEGHSELAVPILYQGQVLGVLDSERSRRDGFSDAERATLQSLANVAASRIASAIAERDRRNAELALYQAREERLTSLGILAGGIAHDFNNLLTTILGNVDLAQQADGRRADRDKALTLAHQACLQARDLTRQLLTFAKGGAPVKRAGAIAEVIESAASFALHGSNLRCDLSLPTGLHAVEMDAGQINQVLQNLIINADQAMPEGGVLRVAARNVVRAESAGGERRPAVEISIQDRGPGIPDHLLSRIFDPYFTTKADGSGLGLTTAHWIVQRHGGRLEVSSRAGHGTTFRITLPAAALAPVKAEDRIPELTTRGCRVLVMDDDEAVRGTVALMLETLGHTTTAVTDGRQAIEQFRQARRDGRGFDFLILDLTVRGGMGGRETLRRLRRLDPGVRAIVASGYSTDPVLAEHRRHGFQAMIEKPFSIEGLERAVNEARRAAPASQPTAVAAAASASEATNDEA